MPIKPMNPYATPRPGEDIANGFISFSLKTLREHDASVFEAGRQAERWEREREHCRDAQGDNAGQELYLEE